MTELENLRANFSHVLAGASLREIETMLRVIGAELEPRFHDVSLAAYQAAQELYEYRRGKRGQHTFRGSKCAPDCSGPNHDEGGESG